MDTLKTLLDFCAINSISGRETEIVNFLTEKLKKYSNKIQITTLKNVICKINGSKPNSKKIVIEAHIDTVGMVVEKITEEGFLKIAACGGLDPKVLISKEVVVVGEKNFTGFIFCNSTKDQEKINLKNLFVDINLNKEEAEKNISIGDSVVFKYNPIKLKNDEIAVRFLDNRASVATIFLILEKLEKIDLNFELYLIFSSLEETSQDGAKTAANQIKPDIAICLDTSFAKTPTCKQPAIGKMGDGPLVGVSPALNKDLSSKLIEIAKKNNIPYQLEIMNEKTHTNADEILISENGVKTCLCSIPIKNMHTPIESISLKDVENTANLIYNFITTINIESKIM